MLTGLDLRPRNAGLDLGGCDLDLESLVAFSEPLEAAHQLPRPGQRPRVPHPDTTVSGVGVWCERLRSCQAAVS